MKQKKPEWNKIKTEKKLFINNLCFNYINKIFENAEFQDNIKSINADNLKKSIIEIPGIYDGVAPHKTNELNFMINELFKIQ